MTTIAFALGIIIGLLIGVLEKRSFKKQGVGLIERVAKPLIDGKKQTARFIKPKTETDMETIINNAFQNVK